MALSAMVRDGIVKHVVSQNCDGLHVRSGIPQEKLSEIHGNIFVEYCHSCHSQFWRDFDVSTKSRRNHHDTGRRCGRCGGKLRDTIVHFGEKGKLDWPLNWKGAVDAARKADVLICFGTSLSVLRRYSSLWPKPGTCKLFIVNLQWTPKDSRATLKLNGNSDAVFCNLSELLSIEPAEYKPSSDPLLKLFTPLSCDERLSTKSKYLFTRTSSDGRELDEKKPEVEKEPEVEKKPEVASWFGTGLRGKKKRAVGKKKRIRRRVKV